MAHFDTSMYQQRQGKLGHAKGPFHHHLASANHEPSVSLQKSDMSMAQLNPGLGPFHCRAPNKKLWRLSAFWPQLVTAVDENPCASNMQASKKKPALPLCPTFGTAPPTLEADWLKCIKGFFQSLKPYHLLSFNSFNHNTVRQNVWSVYRNCYQRRNAQIPSNV